MTDLQFTSTDDLLAELFDRHETSVFCGIPKAQVGEGPAVAEFSDRGNTWAKIGMARAYEHKMLSELERNRRE